MLHSPQATLGRRFVELSGDATDPARVRTAIDASQVLAVECPADRVGALLGKLDRRFVALAQRSPPRYSEYSKLWHVRDPEPYCVLRNCNQFTGDWLRELGCGVRGFAVLSKFRVDPDASHYALPDAPE